MLESQTVRDEALWSLDGRGFPASGNHLDTLRALVSVQDPVFDCLPLHFCGPRDSAAGANVAEVTGSERLLALAVSGKLLYAQLRWLDAVLDGPENPPHSIVHQVNEALVDLIQDRMVRGAADPPSALRVLSKLYARYSASAVLDATYSGTACARFGFDDYVAQAKARAAPVRAPVDAVLAESGASPQTRYNAAESFELFTVGLQFYDDALDAEEDFRDRRPSWLVCATLGDPSNREIADAEPDRFYEKALTGGFVSESLRAAEQHFKASYSLAEPRFPSWAEFQRQYSTDAAALREQYDDLISSAT